MRRQRQTNLFFPQVAKVEPAQNRRRNPCCSEGGVEVPRNVHFPNFFPYALLGTTTRLQVAWMRLGHHLITIEEEATRAVKTSG